MSMPDDKLPKGPLIPRMKKALEHQRLEKDRLERERLNSERKALEDKHGTPVRREVGNSGLPETPAPSSSPVKGRGSRG